MDVQTLVDNKSKKKPNTLMTRVACESKLRSAVGSSMYMYMYMKGSIREHQIFCGVIFYHILNDETTKYKLFKYISNVFVYFQQVLLSLSSTISIPLIVADKICAGENGVVRAELVGTFLVMCGFSTFLQCTFGTR